VAEARRSLSFGWLAIIAVALGIAIIAIGIVRDGGPPEAPERPSPESLAGVTVALDPGHNGGNAADPDQIAVSVPDGRGGTKACNTTGTRTADGYPEHAFAWDVAVRARSLLEAVGATVLLTRDGDDGVGPCVDERGRFGQEHDADLVVSIHGNGSQNAGLRGYFAIVSEPPLNAAQGAPSISLAEALLEALDDAGLPRSSSYPEGLSLRSDLAGLNLAQRPAVLLELGEMRNVDDAALMSSAQGRQAYAAAVAAGIATWADDSDPG
jgi:N-acetylmuramoyl-L-alanine amidase